MNKKYLVKFLLTTIIILIINAYFYFRAQQCPLPTDGYQTLCGSEAILIIAISLLVLIPYAVRTVVYFIAEKTGKQNPGYYANTALFITGLFLVIAIIWRLYA